MEELKCPQCGAAIDPRATECKYCGEKISIPQTASQTASGGKSKVAAGILAILLGALGIHKFYLGYTKEGIIMLAVSLVGSLLFGLGAAVMAIIGLVEGIIYLTKSDAEFEEIYAKGHKGWF